MAIGADGQETREESPTSQPGSDPGAAQLTQPDASGAAAAPSEAPQQPAPPAGDDGASELPRDERGRFAKPAEQPDAVEDVVSRLSRPQPVKPDAKPAAKPAVPPKQPPASADPAAKPPVPPPAQDEQLSDLNALKPSDEERRHWKESTAKRFDTIFGRLEQTSRQLKEAEPFIQRGKDFSKVIDDYELEGDLGFVPPDHLAGLIQTQAQVNRSLLALQQNRVPLPEDVQALTAFHTRVTGILSKIGVAAQPSQPAKLEPFQGELPPDLDELVSVYGIDEATVRLVAAARQPAASKPPGGKAPPAAVQPPQPAPPVQAQQRQVGPDIGQLKTNAFLAELTNQGEKDSAARLQVLLAHTETRNEVMRKYPGVAAADVAAVFNALPIDEQLNILRAVNKTTKAGPKVPPSQPPPTRRPAQTGAPPRQTTAPVDDLDAVISRLSRSPQE